MFDSFSKLYEYRPCNEPVVDEKSVKHRRTKRRNAYCLLREGHDGACSNNVDDMPPLIVNLYHD